MKAQLRNQVAALFLLAPAALTFTALPSTAAAQAATPQVFSFEVSSDHGLDPGSRLHFRVEGTPDSRASIRIAGARDSIPLAETARGVYTGRYMVSRADRIDEDSAIRAILRQGNLTVAANYNFPPGLGNVAAAAPPLRIERFHVSTLDRIEPGAELRFTLEGIPGAVAFVDLPGIANDIRLHETRPGHYEGSYTIRRTDDLNMRGPVVATLRAGDRIVTSTLDRPLVAAGPADLPIHILSHSNNAQVDGGQTHVRGRTAPFASVNVKVDAIPPVVGQLGVTQRVFSGTLQADANGNFDFRFSPSIPLPGTRYDISMTANKADVTTDARLVLYQRQG
ncbi:MAG TPA: hypothetical protein VN649_11300 [Ramlibacter sp.]|nr:hypothetical protein [Ramlibacter sp.]